ncbi:MAG TPA: Stf0 family sulfotransferase, partial [Thermomicrobiales bacterium]|nr:Stf0 family sulfotransferase [Thermomicrobiales bacterium]
ARSGSTLLCQALAGSGVAGDPKEFFGAKMAMWMKRWDAHAPDAFVARLIRERATPNGVFGAKLLWRQLLGFEAYCRQYPEYADLSRAAIFDRLFPNLRYVWISRDDKARQAISYWKARESGVWGQRGPRPTIPLKTPEFDFAGIDALFQTVLAEEAAIDRYCAENGIKPHRVVYEALARDYAPTTRAALTFLGIPDADTLPIADPRTQKLADAESDRWAERFREMQARPTAPEAAGPRS